MLDIRRKLFSQNFLHSRKLISTLLRGSSIGKNDLVLEIGPGKGIITEQLLYHAQHVLAVEIDVHWYTYLNDKFKHTENVTFYKNDFLSFKLPLLPYKVFANIPFSIEGKILRRLIDAENPPQDCYLVMMKELANRLAAPYRENQFSLLHKPWFDFSLHHSFQRTDFTPVPKVDAVMLRFTKRSDPLLSWEEHKRYKKFIEGGFGHGLPVLRNLKEIYGEKVAIKICQELGIRRKMRPSELSLIEWISLYKKFVKVTTFA